MTALTHAQCIDAFEHITRNVMWQEDGDPLLKALTNAGIDDINSLLILDAKEIDGLKYDDNGTMTLLGPGYKNLITIFVAYVRHRILDGTPIGNDYLSVTAGEFDKYQITDYLYLLTNGPSNTTFHLTKNPQQHDNVADFFGSIRQQLVDTTNALANDPEPPIADVGDKDIGNDTNKIERRDTTFANLAVAPIAHRSPEQPASRKSMRTNHKMRSAQILAGKMSKMKFVKTKTPPANPPPEKTPPEPPPPPPCW
jgi:hypothetical protein